MVSVEADVAEQALMLLGQAEPIIALEYVALLGRVRHPRRTCPPVDLPTGGPAHRRNGHGRSGICSGFLPDIPRWVAGRVAGGEPLSICARIAAAMRTDEYIDQRLEHYLVVTDRRVPVCGRNLPNGAARWTGGVQLVRERLVDTDCRGFRRRRAALRVWVEVRQHHGMQWVALRPRAAVHVWVQLPQ